MHSNKASAGVFVGGLGSFIYHMVGGNKFIAGTRKIKVHVVRMKSRASAMMTKLEGLALFRTSRQTRRRARYEYSYSRYLVASCICVLSLQPPKLG